ncbi:NADPH-dependent FMN reductase [Marinobacterium mangrovicola]|uniref:NAD(P)H-dependent FMN reductase n=1 Tax=Marinobacterium mangrovicola TaxID=1476959 RepID=A0A4R1GMP3_9GAMM|nr:NAD(P)H-dependent oxidoreductase [Marinobacterium mangrovicola]TCK08511.1 NAD(P)H-dependent FMN reductase [Marinobacterium mangrovicola]
MAIKIVTICGSVRPGNYTAKALAVALDELKKYPEVEVSAIHLEELDLPLPGLEARKPKAIEAFQATVKGATGVILASPEYHGGISSPMKLAIDNLGFPSVLADKPVSILGVAAGVIGAIKSTEQLRGICSHVGALPLPMVVSVAKVQQVFDEDGNCLDENMENLIRSSARNLIEFLKDTVCAKVSLEEILREQGEAH